MKPQTRCLINETSNSLLQQWKHTYMPEYSRICSYICFLSSYWLHTWNHLQVWWPTIKNNSLALKIIHFWSMFSFHTLYRDEKRTMAWNWLTKSWKQSVHWFYSICQYELRPKYMVTVSLQTRYRWMALSNFKYSPRTHASFSLISRNTLTMGFAK